MTTATAPGKAILLGEHAVVYRRPAIAVPVSGRRARVEVRDAPAGEGVTLDALDLGLRYPGEGPCVDDHGRFLQAVLGTVLAEIGRPLAGLDLYMTVQSSIPIARGMGSGAAVSCALMRAVAGHLGATLEPATLSRLVYETERLLHGTPSGIDNATVAYERPVWFIQGQPPKPLTLGSRLTLLIGDTGVPASTREAVASVRARWQADPHGLEARFDAIGGLVQQGRMALASGDMTGLGRLMDRNQAELAGLGVSSPALDSLIVAARQAGALGAKLTGGGRGGCMLALVAAGSRQAVGNALRRAGAVQVIETEIGCTG